MHARRQAASFLQEKSVLKKLFNETVGIFKTKKGGYTRLIKTLPRRGDAAPTAILQLIGYETQAKEEAPEEKKIKAKTADKK